MHSSSTRSGREWRRASARSRVLSFAARQQRCPASVVSWSSCPGRFVKSRAELRFSEIAKLIRRTHAAHAATRVCVSALDALVSSLETTAWLRLSPRPRCRPLRAVCSRPSASKAMIHRRSSSTPRACAVSACTSAAMVLRPAPAASGSSKGQIAPTPSRRPAADRDGRLLSRRPRRRRRHRQIASSILARSTPTSISLACRPTRRSLVCCVAAIQLTLQA